MRKFIYKIFPWLIFIVSFLSAIFIPYSHWAVNAENLGKTDIGLALFFAFSGAYVTYISLGTTAISLFFVFVYTFLKNEQYKVFVLSFLIGLIPILYLLLD